MRDFIMILVFSVPLYLATYENSAYENTAKRYIPPGNVHVST